MVRKNTRFYLIKNVDVMIILFGNWVVDSSLAVFEGFIDTANTNIDSLCSSSRNWCSEMVEILWVDFEDCRYLISLVLQSMFRLCNSNHGNPETIGCSRLLIILNNTTHAKLFSATLTGFNSSTIFPEVMGRPSMTTTKVGQGSFLRDI